jgi:hypothetical protein
LDYTVATIAFDHIIETMLSDTTVAFVLPLVAMLTSTPAMQHVNHLWNFSVFQRVHILKLV